ncbi:MAG: aromatic ring-hydroxylating dioxygenase subunit alpha [Elusimicrobia bacterium]|nr:aromatic ring-hydroxylating dioxygenase subunit alpha [Elusimicrobiota bacterium]
MDDSLEGIVGSYDPAKGLADAETIPRVWYVDPRVYELETRSVFGGTWQFAARLDQLQRPGDYVTTELAGEPIVLTRSSSGIHAFFNVCRHHAAIVMTEPAGSCSVMRCPYHGWTYGLDGKLKAAPDMGKARGMEKAGIGLPQVRTDVWGNFVFVNLDPEAGPLREDLGGLPKELEALGADGLKFFERRTYEFKCNWKVYVDNYMDGGYHIPILHKSLNAVIDYPGYTIENKGRYVVQKCPLKISKARPETSRIRRGKDAYYYWLYPNFMINWYEGVMDTNLVLPVGHERTVVVFDFYFDDVSPAAAERNKASVDLGEKIQHEDQDISISVQKGLQSRSYRAGRLSERREGGEQLFHKLLHADLLKALKDGKATDSNAPARGRHRQRIAG